MTGSSVSLDTHAHPGHSDTLYQHYVLEPFEEWPDQDDMPVARQHKLHFDHFTRRI